jgi:hypothetical protein
MPKWEQSQFFIAPTQLNCDRDLDGEIIGTVERLGVVIAYVKDRRALTRPVAAAARDHASAELNLKPTTVQK